MLTTTIHYIYKCLHAYISTCSYGRKGHQLEQYIQGGGQQLKQYMLYIFLCLSFVQHCFSTWESRYKTVKVRPVIALSIRYVSNPQHVAIAIIIATINLILLESTFLTWYKYSHGPGDINYITPAVQYHSI